MKNFWTDQGRSSKKCPEGDQLPSNISWTFCLSFSTAPPSPNSLIVFEQLNSPQVSLKHLKPHANVTEPPWRGL